MRRRKLRATALRLLREWRSNIIVWIVQWIGGSAMISAIGQVLWREFHRAPLDWYFLGAVFLVGLILVVIGAILQQRHTISTDEKLKEIEAKIPPPITVNGILAGLPKQEVIHGGVPGPDMEEPPLESKLVSEAHRESVRLREHLEVAEQRADRLLRESKQLDGEKAALEKNNQELKGRISEVEQRWNNSALLSGQFLQEAATLSGELILVWLREHCPTKTQFSSISMAENLGISRDAALHGLELLQREYRLVTRPLQNVDGWEYIPSLAALQPTLKATTRLQQATREETVRVVSICLARFRVDESTISRGRTLKIRYEIDASEDVSDNIWLGASIPYDQGKKMIAEKKQDKRISLYAGMHEYDRDLTIPPDAPLGNYKLQANVWQREKIIARGNRIDIVIVA